MDISFLGKFKYFTPVEIQYVILKPAEDLTEKEQDNLFWLILGCDNFRDKLRKKLGEPKAVVNLIDINKYNHSDDSQHYLFKAADFWIGGLKNKLNINNVVELLIQVGFKGIGVYRNEKGYYSFHADIRSKDNFQQWKGTKEKHEDDWTYTDLVEF